jgi:hypothetical protein
LERDDGVCVLSWMLASRLWNCLNFSRAIRYPSSVRVVAHSIDTALTAPQ